MLTVGDIFPDFSLTGVVSSDPKTAFQNFDQNSDAGRWKIFFSWPKDFTFVCPTEIAGFGTLYDQFGDRDTAIYGFSVDSEYVHLAWRSHTEELKNLPYPMLSDIKRELSEALGTLDAASGVAKRATFIVDPQGIIRFVYVTDMLVGRNPHEVLRVLDALQTDSMCPCNWQKGDALIEA